MTIEGFYEMLDIGNKEIFNLSKMDIIGIFKQSMNDWLMEI